MSCGFRLLFACPRCGKPARSGKVFVTGMPVFGQEYLFDGGTTSQFGALLTPSPGLPKPPWPTSSRPYLPSNGLKPAVPNSGLKKWYPSPSSSLRTSPSAPSAASSWAHPSPAMSRLPISIRCAEKNQEQPEPTKYSATNQQLSARTFNCPSAGSPHRTAACRRYAAPSPRC